MPDLQRIHSAMVGFSQPTEYFNPANASPKNAMTFVAATPACEEANSPAFSYEGVVSTGSCRYWPSVLGILPRTD